MQAAMADDTKRLSDDENVALLEWFNSGMLTQLGHLTRKRDGSHSDMFGICRKSARQLLADSSYVPMIATRLPVRSRSAGQREV